MQSALIGHTGFVGGALATQHHFDECYHSKNIADIRGREFDLLVCSGVSAAKWWANQHADEDRSRIASLLDDLAQVRARRVIVISTVDVYPQSSGVDESFDCESRPNHAYGTNRLWFEQQMRALFSDPTVVRISGVFGPGLKKNVIFDLLHDNCLDAINPASSFQYYNIANLWRDLERLDKLALKLVNLASEPIQTEAIIAAYFPGKIVGAKAAPEAHYDIRTLHGDALGSGSPYLTTAGETMQDLGQFVRTFSASRTA